VVEKLRIAEQAAKDPKYPICRSLAAIRRVQPEKIPLSYWTLTLANAGYRPLITSSSRPRFSG
jgi:hypothetical protein